MRSRKSLEGITMFDAMVSQVKRYLVQSKDLSLAWDAFLNIAEKHQQFHQTCHVVNENRFLESVLGGVLEQRTPCRGPFRYLTSRYNDNFYHGLIMSGGPYQLAFIYFQDINVGSISMSRENDDYTDYYRFSAVRTTVH